MQKITIRDVEYVAFELAQELLPYDEPIPNYNSRFPNSLESCLGTPFQSFSHRPLYRGLISKASMLFYLMIKNHPFQNGNKRIAITTLLVFLKMNKKWLQVDLGKLYEFTVWIASSSPKLKDEVVEAIKRFLRLYIINLN